MKYIMAIDQGTTGSTVAIINTAGRVLASADQDFPQIYPRPGWVEHNVEEIWQTVKQSAEKALAASGVKPIQVAAVGITNQRETVVAWRKSTGETLHNAIVWQCRRTSVMCDKLRPKWDKKIRAKTGLVLDPYFSGSKIRWLIENVPGVKKALRDNDLAFGTIDTFLMWRLSGGKIFATDVTNASRTMLLNLKTLQWDEELLRLFKVPLSALPEIKSSADHFGFCAETAWTSHETRVSGVVGDQQAALFGQACFSVGEAKCTFGTGSFILLNTGNVVRQSRARMLSTVAWRIKNEKAVYALEGGAFICGAAVQWLRDGLALIKDAAEIESLASQVADSQGVEFVPALTGLGAPHWEPEARGEITGLTRGTTRAHIARATLEALALQNADILRAMEKDLGKKLKGIKVDGGASQNNLLMQLQADYLQTRVVRPQNIETTSMGAAYMAGLGAGFWTSLEEIRAIWAADREFRPKLSKSGLKKRLIKWERAIAKARPT
jgi:glycerol kinase